MQTSSKGYLEIDFFCRCTSYSEFTYYASGRQNCFYSLFKMEMLRRHCILSTFITEQLQPSKDILTVDIPIRFPNADTNQPSQIPIEFFLCQKKFVNQCYDQYEHLKQFVSETTLDHLPTNPKNKNGFAALAEAKEIGNQLIDANIAEVINKYGDALLDVHITDQQIYNKQ